MYRMSVAGESEWAARYMIGSRRLGEFDNNAQTRPWIIGNRGRSVLVWMQKRPVDGLFYGDF
jgi:hypothetical protein